MPIYEYLCRKCHNHFEIMQKITDKSIATCPKCNGEATKVISQTSFTLKGGGWYKDGYSSSKGGATSTSPKKDTPTKTVKKD